MFWPGQSNPNLNLSGNNVSFAPYIDVDNDSIYNPLNGDYPQISGDQSVWHIMNDIGGIKMFEDGNSVDGIGLEIQVESFAFSSNDVLNDVIFQKYTITNKGNIILNNTY